MLLYKQLGFDSFTAMEFMNITEYTPTGWAKDKFLIDEIIKAMDAIRLIDIIIVQVLILKL